MILLALLLATSAAPDLGEPPRGPPLSDQQLDARTNEIGALLRCPVCQGLSVSDSPATMARNMKAEVREKLAAGYDQEQILASFERSYGEFVRLEPPMRGVNWMVWFGPLAVLLAGGAGIAWAMRTKAAPPAEDVPSRDAVPDDAQLAAAVRRVRALAYGWPGGLSPKETP
jgi:cytochrome c-type biogenesis protein CcmH